MRDNGPQLIAVARILAPQGIRGEVRVEPLTDNATRLTTPCRFILSRGSGSEPAAGDREAELVSGRPHGKFFALKFAGIETMSDAETLRNLWVKVAFSELRPLPEGAFYLFEIVGCDVVTEDGQLLGKVDEILSGTGNDVYVVRGPRGEVLLPATREVVRGVDREKRTMTVRPLQPYEGGSGKQ